MSEERKRNWFFIILGIVLIIAPPVVRLVWFHDGQIYAGGIGNINAFMAATAVGGAALLYRGATRKPAQPQGAITLLASFVAVGTGAFATAQYFFPETPRGAAAAACANAPLEGAAFYAQTTEQGANSRSGPGRQFKQNDHFPASCTIGIDGYCLGEPQQDITLEPHFPDIRWLIVHGLPDRYVPAAFVGFQGGEGPLGKPDASCEGHGLPFAPPVAKVELGDRDPGGSIPLTAAAPGAYLVGYAVALKEHPEGSYVQPGQSDARPNFAVSWDLGKKNPFPGEATGDVWVAAAICLAGNASQVDSLRVAEVTLNDGAVAGSAGVVTETVPEEVRHELEQVACARSVIFN
ncbi:hypothetical protein LWP59_34580 [Amycolatopsis acidiphila]|uniref:Uncharacterized protein n=1 Tax=Amycolatopsis acidiphila TaxID=715473 RepID=A0A558A0I7_9PSEU|nr:hypothetical protein [Amycolatopsis acidiphila]TVT17783.1 hypothetical protein FNH06_30025 [Amycolatopsis acidiphila]UIJ59131.1 hypothetical protein LWP59_34580 [Amycolatopsis acidiphila]GHG97991.1 hypothetical protein GCM10017788_77730 [Amycolatopsis acidiphila]